MNLILASILVLLANYVRTDTSGRTLALIMPGIPPEEIHEEDYLCRTFKTNEAEAEYITEFKPNASDPLILHHILIFGCETPKEMKEGMVWKCGDMPYHACGAGKTRTLYSWSRNGTTFTLPEGVGFKVGGDTKLNYLILHVHYVNISRITSPDDSGFFLTMVPESAGKITKSAGILSLESDSGPDKRAVIKAHTTLHFENACPINTTKVLHPFALRPNSNPRGTVNSGWRIRKSRGTAKWTLIGRYSLNPNQDFYKIKDKSLAVNPGDWLAMRCTMVNNNDFGIYFGADDSNETCNLYVMYYVDGDDNEKSMYCTSYGPPYYSWANDTNLPGDSVPDWVDIAASRPVFEN